MTDLVRDVFGIRTVVCAVDGPTVGLGNRGGVQRRQLPRGGVALKLGQFRPRQRRIERGFSLSIT